MDHDAEALEMESDAVDDASDLVLTRGDRKNREALIKAARQVSGILNGRMPCASLYVVSRYSTPIYLAGGGALLFNARTRSLVRLTTEEATAFAGLATNGPFAHDAVADRLFLRVLQDGGHIVGANDDERATVRQLHDQSRDTPHALNLTIAPTMACNFACGYCFQGLAKAKSRLEPAVRDALVAFVKQREGLKTLRITWYGGEPLMMSDTVVDLSDRLITYCDTRGIAYSSTMVTNAHLLTPDVVRKLHTHRVSTIQVTLDGDRESHDSMRPLLGGGGTYDTILANLEHAVLESPIMISLRVNVGRQNIAAIDGLLDELVARKLAGRRNFGVYFAKIELSTPETVAADEHLMPPEDFSRALLLLEDRARSLGLAGAIEPPSNFTGLCVAAVSGGYVVVPNGDLHKCWETAHDPAKRTGSLMTVPTTEMRFNAAMWTRWSPFDNPVCAECRILPLCGGHCAQRVVCASPDQQASPCPSWKGNFAEYVFRRALQQGAVKPEDWLESEATALTGRTGDAHNAETLQQAHDTLRAAVERELEAPAGAAPVST